MDWCCSRCGHRQAEEKACGGCGADSVQDLRSRAGRAHLEEVEGRHKESKENLAKKLAAAGGVCVAIGVMVLRGGYLTGIGAGSASAIGMWQALERALYKPRFPFLASLPPADRP